MTTTSSDALCSTSDAPQKLISLSFNAKITVSVVYGVLFMMGVYGNVVVMKVIRVLRKRTCIQQTVNYHMTSMACSDLLILIIGIPTELHAIIWCPSPWPTGNLGCKCFYFIWEVSSYATIFNILAFSIERYLAICHPLQLKQMSRTRTKKLITLVWLAAVVFGVPILFSIGIEDALMPFQNSGESRPPIWICTNISSQKGIFRTAIYTSFSLYLLVLLLVAVTCQQMMRKLLTDKSGSLRVKTINGSVQDLPMSGDAGGHRTSARQQTIVMLGCIMGALAICWIPFQSRRLMTVLRIKSQWTDDYYNSYIVLQPITNSFYYLSSTVNPFLYNLSSRQFRRVFLLTLKRCHSWNKEFPISGLHSESNSFCKRNSSLLQVLQNQPGPIETNPDESSRRRASFDV
ncbi:G-protein coupled receptor 39-like [Protopterus annectens]|uniref:G-protein coupled receptor 39-like n=1 Tax=Protopterus annectens TaxID=7888 RepID=UPI001CFC2837|nr:G-protein coupled receptor 39-like [Protopterus annectens]